MNVTLGCRLKPLWLQGMYIITICIYLKKRNQNKKWGDKLGFITWHQTQNGFWGWKFLHWPPKNRWSFETHEAWYKTWIQYIKHWKEFVQFSGISSTKVPTETIFMDFFVEKRENHQYSATSLWYLYSSLNTVLQLLHKSSNLYYQGFNLLVRAPKFYIKGFSSHTKTFNLYIWGSSIIPIFFQPKLKEGNGQICVINFKTRFLDLQWFFTTTFDTTAGWDR